MKDGRRPRAAWPWFIWAALPPALVGWATLRLLPSQWFGLGLLLGLLHGAWILAGIARAIAFHADRSWRGSLSFIGLAAASVAVSTALFHLPWQRTVAFPARHHASGLDEGVLGDSNGWKEEVLREDAVESTPERAVVWVRHERFELERRVTRYARPTPEALKLPGREGVFVPLKDGRWCLCVRK